MTAPIPNPFGLSRSWELALRAERKSDRTIETYLLTVDLLARWLTANDQPADDVQVLTPDTVRGWLSHLSDTRSAETCRTRYVALRQFVKWCLDEEELDADPMANIKQPTSPPKITAPLDADAIGALVRDCAGRDFTNLRDRAILMLFADTGARLSGITDLREPHIDLLQQTARIVLKGGKELDAPFGSNTAAALDRYLRAKHRMKYGDRDWLWLSATNKGRFTKNGIYQMMRRRADRLGIKLHPHLFRHSFAHTWLDGGGSESDLMQLLGWSSEQMVRRYASATRADRARKAYMARGPMYDV